MKKTVLLFTVFISIVMLAACGGGDGGGEKKETTGKSKIIEATIEDASFVLLTQNGEYDPESNYGMVKIDVNIKNKTKESIDIMPQAAMYLYDGDDQIDAEMTIDTSLDISYTTNNSIGAEKQKTYSVMFNVERDKEYELNIEPNMLDIEKVAEPIILKVNMSDYNDSYEKLSEPIEALQAYIETIYLGEAHENLNELMNIDEDEQMKAARKGFARFLKDVTGVDVSQKEHAKYYKVFKKVWRDQGEFDVQLRGNSGEKALVKITYAGVSSTNVSEGYHAERRNFLEKAKTFNGDEADEYALSKLDSIINQSKVIESRRAIDIYMVKKDGKWSFDNKYNDSAQDLNKAFAEGKIY